MKIILHVHRKMENVVKPLMYPDVKRSSAKVTSKGALIRCVMEVRSKFVFTNGESEVEKKRDKKLKKQLKKLKHSCFGILFQRLRSITFSSGLIHHILLRQALNDNPNVMKYNFNGQGAIFTNREFGIITGLKMSNTST